MEGTFTFDDFLATMQQVLQMGNLRSLLGMMPGVPKEIRSADLDESRISRITGMIHSMTPSERVDPDLIDASRRRRIAAGAGCRPADVKALVEQFKQMRSMMRGLGGAGAKSRSGGFIAGWPKVGKGTWTGDAERSGARSEDSPYPSRVGKGRLAGVELTLRTVT